MATASAPDLTPFLKLWPILLLLAAVGAVKLALWWREGRRIARSGIEQVDAMDGIMFERFLATLFAKLGYHVERTKARGDYGADLVVERNGERMVVQAKRWSKNVGVKAVQEAHAAPAMYSCSRALVVTNSRFTQQAKELARANRVELWDRDALIDRMLA